MNIDNFKSTNSFTYNNTNLESIDNINNVIIKDDNSNRE